MLSFNTYLDGGTPPLTYLCPPLTGALLDVSTRCTSPSWLDQIIPHSPVPDSPQSLPRGTLYSCPGHCGHQSHSISQREPLWAISPPHSALPSCRWPPASAPPLSLPSGQALGAPALTPPFPLGWDLQSALCLPFTTTLAVPRLSR